uniref:Aquaporin-5-like n=1 Tax=Crassostrea virginica TaxID=6565 RepID=A0A8B8EFA6_CRAVI|nr:aquaporin-5-like [Crassostrea virginica]
MERSAARNTSKRSTARDWKQRFRMLTSIDDLRSLRFWKAVAAECLGSLLLVLVGCGSCVDWDTENKVVRVSLCFGLAYATIIWTFYHVSGGHINPSITFAHFVTRRVSLARAGLYIVAQLIGALIGAGILKGLTPSSRGGAATKLHQEMNSGQGFGVELFITFFLVLTYFATYDKKRKDLSGSFPLTIGLAIAACHLFAYGYTGASLNTARSFGAAAMDGEWQDHWVYWLGPFIGATLGGLVYDNAFAVNASLEKARAFLLASEYEHDSYPAKKTKIKVIQEEVEEVNSPADKPALEST